MYVPRNRDRDGEVECTQCLSTLGILSIARLFAEEEPFCAICHFSAMHLQRNYLSILPVCSFAPWYRRAVPTLAVGNCWTFNQKVCLCCKKAHLKKKKKSALCLLYSWVSYQCQESPENNQLPILRVGDIVSEARVSLEEPGSVLEALCVCTCCWECFQHFQLSVTGPQITFLNFCRKPARSCFA